MKAQDIIAVGDIDVAVVENADKAVVLRNIGYISSSREWKCSSN